jgi:MFS family permease
MWRGSFAAVLALGMAAATFAQYVFGVLGSFLIDEFSISRSQLGLLTTSAFVVGALCSPAAGSLVDRLGGRRVFLGSMAVVGLAIVGMAVAPSFALMLVFAGVAGVALCCCNPMTNKLIAAHLRPGERGITMGLKQAGVQIGAFLIGVLVPSLAAAVGWRFALASTIVMPLVAAIAAFSLIERERDLPPQEIGSKTGSLEDIVWWVTAYAVLMGAGVATIGTYLPLYAYEQLGFSVGTAGLVIGAMGAIGIPSRVVWGWVGERYGRFALPLALMGIGSAVATVLVIGAGSERSWLLWPAVVLFGATAVTWNVVGMLAIVAEVDTGAAGLASGYVQTGFYSGFVVSPPLFGYLADRTGEYTRGWACVACVFVLATGLAFVWEASDRRRLRDVAA